jgi:hypothetical protein
MIRLRPLAIGLSLLAPLGGAVAAPAQPPAGQLPANPGDAGFRLEPKPIIDDVFGDVAEYRRTIDRFLGLCDSMQKVRDEFAQAVQGALVSVQPPPGAKSERPLRKCPAAQVAQPYARALKLGRTYLSTGRELARRYEQVKELDRLGESLGLTPDYKQKVKRVLAQYGALLTDYREMKVAFHDQLTDELKFAGCDPEKLLALATTPPNAPLKDEAWPAPAELAPTIAATPAEAAPRSDEKGDAKVEAKADPKVEAKADPKVDPKTGETAALPVAGILFYVDNTRCTAVTEVALDGRLIGEVPGSTRSAFQATPGPHDLCLLPRGPSTSSKKCGDAGTLRRSYIHEGWTISLRCD